MDSSSGVSSNSPGIPASSPEEDLRLIMDERKKKRMISNRDSARRSRLRKQQHLDELTREATRLRKENQQLITNLNVITHYYINVETENAVLRAQVSELSQWLNSLNEMMAFGGGLCADDGGFMLLEPLYGI